MGSKKHSIMFVHLRRQMIIFLILLGTSLVIFFSFSLLSAQKQNDSTNLLEAIAKQRMLTQMIAKDASRLSVLDTAIKSEDRIQSVSLLSEKRVAAKRSIQESILEYDKRFLLLRTGYVQTEYGKNRLDSNARAKIEDNLIETEVLWRQFKTNAEILIHENPEEQDFKRALIFINENNLLLLEQNESLISDLLAVLNKDYSNERNLLMILIGVIALVALVTIRRLYRYLYKPMDMLMVNFQELGLVTVEDVEGKPVSPINQIAWEVDQMFSGYSELIHMIEMINSSNSFTDTLNNIFNRFRKFVPYTHIGIALFKDDESTVLTASYGVSEKIHEGLGAALAGHTTDISESSLLKIMETGQPRVINDYDSYFKTRPVRGYSQIILKYGVKSSITLPLMANEKQIGFIFFSSSEKDVYEATHIQFLKTVSNAIAMSMEKNVMVDELLYSSILALAKLAEARDEDTGDHLIRMKNNVMLLTQLLSREGVYKDQITAQMINDIEKFSPMHDIGKVGIPDGILLKPGKLTPEEFEIMKTHAAYGADVLNTAEANMIKRGKSMFSEGIAIAIGHHEKWDGSGYPNGVSGADIPLSARIVTVADVLDALMSKRPYKEAFTFEKSVEIILSGRGTHFDPYIIDIFEKHLDLFRDIYADEPKKGLSDC